LLPEGKPKNTRKKRTVDASILLPQRENTTFPVWCFLWLEKEKVTLNKETLKGKKDTTGAGEERLETEEKKQSLMTAGKSPGVGASSYYISGTVAKEPQT